MPYRRLPNTDAARLKALKTALAKGKELPPFKLAFSQKIYQRIQSFLPSFEHAIIQHRQAYLIQARRNKEYLVHVKKARLYISHFIQVTNMAIMRGDLPASVRKYFGLSEHDKKIPSLSTEKEIIEFGERIIQGENTRIQEGGTMIANPTAAMVKVRYENFLESYRHQKTLQSNTSREKMKLAELRPVADEIILSIWNEVENTLRDLPNDLRREKSKEYGLVYVFRKSEIGKINFFEYSQSVAN
jgi:hypothetical protein